MSKNRKNKQTETEKQFIRRLTSQNKQVPEIGKQLYIRRYTSMPDTSDSVMGLLSDVYKAAEYRAWRVQTGTGQILEPFDLCHDAILKLYDKYKNYDPEKGDFLNYARVIISRSVLRSVHNYRPVQLNTAWVRIRAELYRLKSEYREKHSYHEPSVQWLIDTYNQRNKTNYSRYKITTILNYDINLLPAPSKAEIGVSGRCDPAISWRYAETMSLLSQAIQSLDTTSQEILSLYYGLNSDKPLSDQKIANVLGCSRSQVQKLRTKALSMLRQHPVADDLIDWANYVLFDRLDVFSAIRWDDDNE